MDKIPFPPTVPNIDFSEIKDDKIPYKIIKEHRKASRQYKRKNRITKFNKWFRDNILEIAAIVISIIALLKQ